MSETVLHVRWPASRFYWAMLDGSSLPRTIGIPRRQLGFLLETHVPEPIEEVHAVFARVSGQRYLACALPKDTLASEAAQAAITLTPESLPEFIPKDINPSSLNLLTGSFTPRVIAWARSRWILQCAALLLVVAGMLAFGIERRVAALNARHIEIALNGASLVEQRLGYGANASRLPIDLRLQAELRSLRQSRTAPAVGSQGADAASTLTSLLSLWPAALLVETESIQVARDTVNLRATLPTNEDAQTLATALSRLQGFTLAFPSMHAASDATRTELAWAREKGSGR